MVLVIGLGCSSLLSLLVKYNAPILIIGRPSAAQIPAISKRVIGFGNKKYAMDENNGITNAIILIKCVRVFSFSTTKPIEMR